MSANPNSPNNTLEPKSKLPFAEWVLKLIPAIGQAPVIYVLKTQGELVSQHPKTAVVLLIAWEILLFFRGLFKRLTNFFNKVWDEQLEKPAVENTGNFIKSLPGWTLNKISVWRSDFASKFLKQYKTQIIYDHRTFNVRGLKTVGTWTLRLEHVFVDLCIEPSNLQQTPLDPVSIKAKNLSGNRPIWDFLRAGKAEESVPLAIIGAPGSGKTTLLQHIALAFASNQQQGYQMPPSIPVLLFLRDHIEPITQPNPPSLGTLVQNYFANKDRYPDLNPRDGWFEQRLKQDNCIILLDGLDEVASLPQRQTVAKWVDQQVKNYRNCRFVLTARPQGYRSAPLAQAHILEVQPFNAEQVKKFINNWYVANEIMSAAGVDDPGVRQKASREAKDLLTRLQKTPTLSKLTVNPLLLTMIAMVHRYRGALPKYRVELYSEICDVLLGSWRQAKGLSDPLTAAQKRVVLQPLAAYMMDHKTREIGIAQATTVITALLPTIGITDQTPEEFLKETQASSGLILEREAGVWSFAHLTFQEYLTSSHWLELTDTRNWQAIVSDSWWHETILLYAAQSDATPIVETCLAAGDLPAFTLMAECIEEGRKLNSDIRTKAENRLIDDLESEDAGRRRLAAEVKLMRRLKSLQRLDEEREIDMDYISCAEYQLFLDDMRRREECHQPDHWTELTFVKGGANKPITGVRGEDVQAFCRWLNNREESTNRYREPFTEELAEALIEPKDLIGITAWSYNRELNRMFINYSIKNPAFVNDLDAKHYGFATIDVNHNADPDLNNVFELVLLQSLDRARAIDLAIVNVQDRITDRARDRAIGHTFDRTIDHTRAHAIASDFDLACVLDLDLDRALHRARGLSTKIGDDFALNRALSRALSRDFDLTLELDFERVLERVLDPALERAPDHLHVFAQAHAFANFLSYFLEINRITEQICEIEDHYRVNSVSIDKFRISRLLIDILNMLNAETAINYQRVSRHYLIRLLSYAYIGYMELEKEKPDSSLSWWQHIIQGRKKMPEDFKEQKRLIAEALLWLKITKAREDGILPAWESIRIVRESPKL